MVFKFRTDLIILFLEQWTFQNQMYRFFPNSFSSVNSYSKYGTVGYHTVRCAFDVCKVNTLVTLDPRRIRVEKIDVLVHVQMRIIEIRDKLHCACRHQTFLEIVNQPRYDYRSNHARSPYSRWVFFVCPSVLDFSQVIPVTGNVRVPGKYTGVWTK
jgi:hypothetical protein